MANHSFGNMSRAKTNLLHGFPQFARPLSVSGVRVLCTFYYVGFPIFLLSTSILPPRSVAQNYN